MQTEPTKATGDFLMSRNELEKSISVLNDFSDDPFGRYPSDGLNSGERFREEFLKPALSSFNRVDVDLSGNFYGSSFLDEAFGGLVRKGYFRQDELKNGKLEIHHELESYVQQCWKYIGEAEFDSEP